MNPGFNKEQFIVANSPNKGQGLFPLRSFDKDQVIMRFEGTRIHTDNIPNLAAPETYNLLQIERNWYLDLDGSHGFFINHSCEPNCLIKVYINTAFLIALRPIKANEELLFDYATTSTESPETFEISCKCGNYNCRKSISGFALLSQDLQNKYIEYDAVPTYVLASIK